MLIEFTAENFLSFKEPVTLSMVAGKTKARNEDLNTGATFPVLKNLTLLKCAVIYGANASGKSNLFEAIKFMKAFVMDSSRESQVGDAIRVQPFRLALSYEDRPSVFSIAFVLNKSIYRYSFSADKKFIHTEALSVIKGSRETVLFVRDGSDISIKKGFSEGERLQSKTRANALFLSVCANFDGAISKSILKWFSELNVISGLSDFGLMGFTRDCLEGKESEQISALLRGFDLGMERVAVGEPIEAKIMFPGPREKIPVELRKVVAQLEKINAKNLKNVPTVKKLDGIHSVFDEDGKRVGEVAFDLLDDESEGSKKLVAMSGPIVDTLNSSGVLLIDEFDARLHPILSRTIISLFNSIEANKNNAQLIVATHDTNLLDKDLLRRDQIWFAEKDKWGGSHLSSLVEFKIRNDASFEKDYIMGKYGAIPLLGNLAQIFGSVRTKPINPASNEN